MVKILLFTTGPGSLMMRHLKISCYACLIGAYWTVRPVHKFQHGSVGEWSCICAEELRNNGNFTLFRDYNGGVDFANNSPNSTYRQVNLTVETYLECYQRCKDYNSETSSLATCQP